MLMRSVCTGIYMKGVHDPLPRDFRDEIRTLRKIGFNCVDFSFCEWRQPTFVLRGDDWKEKIEGIAHTCREVGMTVGQTHTPFIKFCDPDMDPSLQTEEGKAYYREMLRRSYIATQMLGCRYTVAHPLSSRREGNTRNACIERNHAVWGPYIEQGAKLGVTTCLENMQFLMVPEAYTFCERHEELIELVDSFHDPFVGACWDTGHANLMGYRDQGKPIRDLGSRLKVLHLNDNKFGNCRDEHLIPGMGDVDWPKVLEALVDIGYQGTLNYETGKVAREAGGAMELDLVRMAYANQDYLLKLYEEIRQARSE